MLQRATVLSATFMVTTACQDPQVDDRLEQLPPGTPGSVFRTSLVGPGSEPRLTLPGSPLLATQAGTDSVETRLAEIKLGGDQYVYWQDLAWGPNKSGGVNGTRFDIAANPAGDVLVAAQKDDETIVLRAGTLNPNGTVNWGATQELDAAAEGPSLGMNQQGDFVVGFEDKYSSNIRYMRGYVDNQSVVLSQNGKIYCCGKNVSIAINDEMIVAAVWEEDGSFFDDDLHIQLGTDSDNDGEIAWWGENTFGQGTNPDVSIFRDDVVVAYQTDDSNFLQYRRGRLCDDGDLKVKFRGGTIYATGTNPQIAHDDFTAVEVHAVGSGLEAGAGYLFADGLIVPHKLRNAKPSPWPDTDPSCDSPDDVDAPEESSQEGEGEPGFWAGCGLDCPSGFHPTGYACSFTCETDCPDLKNNFVSCERNSEALGFVQCGTTCPAGFYQESTSTKPGCDIQPVFYPPFENSAFCLPE